MRNVIVGSQGLYISQLGFGCMGISDFYKGANLNECKLVIEKAIDLGINYFDTADMYGPFSNERFLGNVIKNKRNGLVIATKVGVERNQSGAFLGLNSSPLYIRQACENSLLRLGIDTIDVYYIHRVDLKVPIEESVGTIGELIAEGKVRYIGLSEVSASTIRKVHKTFPISVIQTEYSIWANFARKELSNVLAELGIGFIAYSPLGRGFLTGRYQKQADIAVGDSRLKDPRFEPENLSHNIRIFEPLEELAKTKGASLAQLSLAWVIASWSGIVPIFGTTKLGHLQENVGSLNIHLTSDELRFIENLIIDLGIHGDRYPSEAMKELGR